LFQEPYDAYLGYLLKLTLNLSEFDPLLEAKQKEFSLFVGSSSSNRWTLWVSKDIRQLFDQQKSLLASSKTHGAFVELLLIHKQLLESAGLLIPFQYNKKQFDTKSDRHDMSMQSAYSLTPVTPHFMGFQQFNHFNSQLTLSSDMGSSVDMLQDPLLLTPNDSMASMFLDNYPVYKEQPQENLRLRHDTPFDPKKSRYTYGKQEMQYTPRIITNFQNDFNSMPLWTPTSALESELPSPDVLSATNAAMLSPTNFGDTFVMNEMESFINFNFAQ
jgi:hypothetical protein